MSRPKRAVKLAVWERDSYACTYCGVAVIDHPEEPKPANAATVDHVVPYCFGGRSDGNLTTACYACNQARGASMFTYPSAGLLDGCESAMRAALRDAGLAA